MIGKHIDNGAKMARAMYDAGREGKTPAQAVAIAQAAVPAGPYAPKIKGALAHYFKE